MRWKNDQHFFSVEILKKMFFFCNQKNIYYLIKSTHAKNVNCFPFLACWNLASKRYKFVKN